MAPTAFLGTATPIPNRQSDVVRAMVRVRTWYTNFSLRYRIASVMTFSSRMTSPMAFWGFSVKTTCSNWKLDFSPPRVLLVTDTFVSICMSHSGSSGGRVVKLLACGARGPGFDSRPRHLDFQRLVISCFQVEIWLKDRLIDVNPQNNQPCLILRLLSAYSVGIVGI